MDEAKSLLDAQTEVVYLIEEHISLANAKLPEVSPNDRAMLLFLFLPSLFLISIFILMSASRVQS